MAPGWRPDGAVPLLIQGAFIPGAGRINKIRLRVLPALTAT
jgi:hypothetical protein